MTNPQHAEKAAPDLISSSDRNSSLDRIKLELLEAVTTLQENHASDPYNANLGRRADVWNRAGRRR